MSVASLSSVQDFNSELSKILHTKGVKSKRMMRSKVAGHACLENFSRLQLFDFGFKLALFSSPQDDLRSLSHFFPLRASLQMLAR
jgi:hypothetical protein